jgi:hypothetical protein
MAAVKANPTLTSTVQQTGDVTGTFASMPVGPAEWGACSPAPSPASRTSTNPTTPGGVT